MNLDYGPLRSDPEQMWILSGLSGPRPFTLGHHRSINQRPFQHFHQNNEKRCGSNYRFPDYCSDHPPPSLGSSHDKDKKDRPSEDRYGKIRSETNQHLLFKEHE